MSAPISERWIDWYTTGHAPNVPVLKKAIEEIAALEAQVATAIAVRDLEARNKIDFIQQLERSEAQNRQLREPIRHEEAEAILGPDKLPGDASFRIAACQFFAEVMQARAARAATEPKEKA